MREGVEYAILDRALTEVVVGNKAFVATMLARAKGEKTRQRAVQRPQRDLPWNDLQAAVVSANQEPGEAFCNRRGDLGRDLALWVARRFARSCLAGLGTLVGVTCAAIAQTVAKAETRLAKDPHAAALYVVVQARLKLNVGE